MRFRIWWIWKFYLELMERGIQRLTYINTWTWPLDMYIKSRKEWLPLLGDHALAWHILNLLNHFWHSKLYSLFAYTDWIQTIQKFCGSDAHTWCKMLRQDHSYQNLVSWTTISIQNGLYPVRLHQFCATHETHTRLANGWEPMGSLAAAHSS